jgi:hypothetical protein
MRQFLCPLHTEKEVDERGDRDKYGAMLSPPLSKEGQEEIEINMGQCSPSSQKGGTGGDRDKYGAMLSPPLSKEGQEEIEINMGQCSTHLSATRHRST